MARRQTIRNEGADAEQAFIDLVHGSKRSVNPKLGDVIVRVDDEWHYVEVKSCHSDGGTINQVRAIKFIPCVIYAPKHEAWYILSPDQLVRLASTKDRGQHTEIAFESMNFSLKSLPDKFHSRASDESLQREVEAAIRRGVAAKGLKQIMTECHDAIRSLKERFVRAVQELDNGATKT